VREVQRWIGDAGAQPDETEVRRWLRLQVPEYAPATPPLTS
jgi:hypothetical protein